MEKGSPYAKLFERHVDMKSRRHIWEQLTHSTFHNYWTLLPGDNGDGLFYVDIFRAKHCLAFVYLSPTLFISQLPRL